MDRIQICKVCDSEENGYAEYCYNCGTEDSFEIYYPTSFVEWLKDFCETGIENDEIQWKVMTETHIYDLMSTDRAFEYWLKNVDNG